MFKLVYQLTFAARGSVTRRTTKACLLPHLGRDSNAVVINHLSKYMRFTLQCCTGIIEWLWKCKCGLKEPVRFKGKASLDGRSSCIYNGGISYSTMIQWVCCILQIIYRSCVRESAK